MFCRKNSLLALCFVFLSASWGLAGLKEGDRLPALLPAQFEGDLPSLAGKVVLLDFWASWCGPCKKSFPELERLYEAYKNRGFVILGVSVDEESAAMHKFLKSHPVSFPIVRDRNQSLVQVAGCDSMPTSFLLDRSGKIRSVHSGFRGEETLQVLRREIEKLLDEK
jgi:thiol-disulfide isomerase/thioredoxin